MRLADVAPPSIKSPTQVLLRTLAVSVGESDFQLISRSIFEVPRGEETLILGREAVAVVESVGGSISDFRVGDFVVPTIVRPCGYSYCLPCRSGEPDMCSSGGYLVRGFKGANGFLSEYFVEDQLYLVRVPHGMVDVAFLLEPLSEVDKAIRQVFTIQKRLSWEPKNVVVLGIGLKELMAALYLKSLGLTVYVYVEKQECDVLSRVLDNFNIVEVSTENELLDISTNISGFDFLMMSAVNLQYATLILRILRPNGVGVVLDSQLVNGEIQMPLVNKSAFGNRAILWSMYSNISHFQNALAKLSVMSSWRSAIKRLLSYYMLSDYESAFKDIRAYNNCTKRVIQIK